MITPLSKESQLKLIKIATSRKKSLKNKCARIWALIVKERAGWKCEFPGCTKSKNCGYEMDAHHVISKGAANNMRYDVENGICLCINHHVFGIDSAHRGINFESKFIGEGRTPQTNKRYGKTWIQLLERKAGVRSKLDMELEYLYLETEKKKYDIE